MKVQTNIKAGMNKDELIGAMAKDQTKHDWL